MGQTRTIAGVQLDIEESGKGRPLLFLHPGEGLRPAAGWLTALARSFRVIAPHHPGWGGSALPDWIGTVDDLAYLYLDLIRDLRLDGVTLVGNDLGGWIAAEMAVRDSRGLSGLVLADPVGIKLGGVLDRDIADMHSLPPAEVARLAWADPDLGRIDYNALPDTELAAIARGREAWALFGWKPYMHNPRLRRWLHRIDVPTKLIWGARDGIVSLDYAEGWRREIAGATLEVIDDAGHYPHWEQPEAFARACAKL
jgi:pimeloyl-ACP methyl ester carboxylesterase